MDESSDIGQRIPYPNYVARCRYSTWYNHEHGDLPLPVRNGPKTLATVRGRREADARRATAIMAGPYTRQAEAAAKVQ